MTGGRGIAITLNIGIAFDVNVLSQARYASQLKRLDVLLFPELVDGGYAALAQGAAPHRPGDTFVYTCRSASRYFSLCCVAGSTYYESPSSVRTNTSLVFSHGRLIHRYDKVHLFKPTGDRRYFQPGRSSGVFAVGQGAARVKAGVVICYDLRFPELIRGMAVKGMNILLVPARWPRSRDDAWFTLLKARAIENQVFVVGCNALGEEGGYSYAFDPLGKLVFSNRKNHGHRVHTFRADLKRLHVARGLHNNLEDAVLLKRSGSFRML